MKLRDLEIKELKCGINENREFDIRLCSFQFAF